MSVLTLPYSESPNLAPLKPLQQRITDAQTDNTIEIDPEWFQQQKELLLKENSRVWKDTVLQWELVFLFIEGKQILRRARHGGGWRAVPLPDRTDSPVHALNVLGFYVENAKAKWTNSNTDVRWRPTSDADQAMGSSKAADNIYDYYSRKLYDARYKQLEATLAQCGKYLRYYHYSDDSKAYARRPIIEQQQMQFGDSVGFCADCGYAGPAEEFGGGDQAGVVDAPMDPEIAAIADSMPGSGAGQGTVSGAGLGGLNDLNRQAAPMAPPGQARGGMSGGGGDSAGLDARGAGVEAMPGALREPSASDLRTPGVPAGIEGGATGICPDCGSPNVEIEQSEPVDVETVTGHEMYETGAIICECPPAFEVKHDIAFDPQDSPYLIRSRRIRHAVLQSKFPFLKFGQMKSRDAGLDAQEELKKASFASANRSRIISSHEETQEEINDFIQVWLDPCLYSRLKLRQSYQAMDGMEIPAGTQLIEMFPTGMYMCFITGVDGVVELRDEHHKDFWVGGVLRQRAASSLGSGQEDAIEVQRMMNLEHSLTYTVLRTCANPATLYDATLLPNGTSAYLGNPVKNIPVETQRLEGKSLKDAVFQLQPQPPSQQLFAHIQALNNVMQLTTRVTDFSGALPGVDNDTATGAEIAAANSQNNFAPQLSLKAEVDRRGAEIVLRLFMRYCFDEVYISLSGKRGKQDGVWLSSADIETELFAEVVPESYLPQTNLERRTRLKGLLADVGGLPGLKMAMDAMPSFVEKLAETYDVDLGAEDYTAAAETARRRIDQMGQAIPMLQMAMMQMPPVQMAPDPMTGEPVMVPVDPMAEAGQMLLGVLQPPIEVEEIGHLASINYYRDFLTADEGKEAPPELRAGVKAAIYAHVQGLIVEAQLTGLVGAAGQPPGEEQEEGGESGGKEPEKTNKNPRQGSQQKGGQTRDEMKNKRKERQARQAGAIA